MWQHAANKPLYAAQGNHDLIHSNHMRNCRGAVDFPLHSAAGCNACRAGSASPGHHCGARAAEAAGLLPGSDISAGKVPSYHKLNTPQPAGTGRVTDLFMCWSSLLTFCQLSERWHLIASNGLQSTLRMDAQSRAVEECPKGVST